LACDRFVTSYSEGLPVPAPRVANNLPELALAIVLVVLGLAACGQPDEDGDTGANDAGVDSGSTAETSTAGDASKQQCDLPYAVAKRPSSKAEIDPTVCFRGAPPSVDAEVATLPRPDPACCAPVKPLFFKGDALTPEPTLQVIPYEEGRWVPIITGVQGGIHVDAAVRVVLAGETAPKVKLQIQARGYFGCKEAAVGNAPVIWVRPDADLDQGYTNASPFKAGVEVRFPVTAALWYQYCGIWLELRMAVLHPASGKWGQTATMVRLYDVKPAKR
jgi:hypothetical protein